MTTQLEKVDATKIPGNATLPVKEHIARTLDYARAGESGFALSILKRLEVIDISIVPKAGEPSMRESRVIFELDVTEDMANSNDYIHGGCSAYLIDVCSTMAGHAFAKSIAGDDVSPSTVSQAIELVYHAPALLGDRLRVVNSTITAGGRSLSARSEIWNATRHRLVTTGVHLMTQSSPHMSAKL
ncbi:hypothetical protein PLICRDRAFT_33528 [Plicaturopsis crispa FD-325 SS-3]|nr:hypothetical protein PLICRDRAFT_33528 [Plicaturopsis crispa FD-325 SS-3]